MTQKNYSGSIALSKLKSALITTKKGNRAILIPLNENHLTEKDGSVYLFVRVVTKTEEDKFGQNGFIAQTVPYEVYKELGKDAVKELSLPILGNIKDFSGSTGSNASELGELDPESDDLPF